MDDRQIHSQRQRGFHPLPQGHADPNREVRKDNCYPEVQGSCSKRCNGCGTEKSLTDFYRNKGRGDGRSGRCKQCEKLGRSRGPAQIERDRAYYALNRERINEKQKEHRARNPEQGRARVRKWREKNPLAVKEANRRWREAHPERAREISRETQRRLRKNPAVRIKASVGAQIRSCLRGRKSGHAAFELLDYTVEELRTHLERQFTKGMSWANYGEWHIDHIVPLCSFTIGGVDDPELRRAWALPNLRPLWRIENIRKNGKRVSLL